MNDFSPKEIHKASAYLQEKLESSVQKNEPIIEKEEEKESRLKKFVSSIFKR